MSKTKQQMIDKMAPKAGKLAGKLGGEKKQKEVAVKFAQKKEEQGK